LATVQTFLRRPK